MDSIGRRRGREMARIRRQRSQEWRDRDYSSSDNEDHSREYDPHRYVDERILRYENDVKAGLDVREYLQPQADNRSRPVHPAVPSTLQTVENRAYTPLSGSDGDLDTDAAHVPVQLLLRQQSLPCHEPPTRGRLALAIRRGPSSSSSDNNSDTTYPECDLVRRPSTGLTQNELLNLTNSARTVYPPSGVGSATSLTSTKEFLTDSPRTNTTQTDRSERHHSQQSQQLPQALQQQIHSSQPPTSNHQPHNHHPRPSHQHPQAQHPLIGAGHHPQIQPVSTVNSTAISPPSAVMPVIPVRNNLQSQGGPPSFTSANFHIRKSCSHRCSWKCVAIFLIFLTTILTGLIVYFGAVSTMSTHLENNHACIVVEDAKFASVETASTPSPTVKSIVPTLYPQRVLPGDYESWPVVEVQLGKRFTYPVPAHGFWNMQLKQTQVSFVRLNFTVPPTANFAIFGRRHMPPTVTQYDFQETIHKQRMIGKKNRSTLQAMVEVSFLEHLEPGWWFISVYNDDSYPHTISMMSELALDVTARCPNNCHGHGTCQLGKCNCYSGYAGKECEESVCPVLCSNHGSYAGGVCHCERRWKGVECSVQEQDCEVADCNGHGQCLEGVCFCIAGYKGRFCEEADCLDSRCSEHGVCAQGQCICRPGWRGTNCSQLDDRLVRCLPNCSGHGTFDLETGKCLCDKYWTGAECAEALCGANCGPFGQCIGGQCQCTEGWTGTKCDQRLCDPRCAVHGQCNNGTCVCMQGWNGKHCSLEGCPRDCNHHGECLKQDGEYKCTCHNGWDGDDCSIRLENVCDDGIDNDNGTVAALNNTCTD